MTGQFITIEGSEGAGKSTVLQTVIELLEQQGIEVVVTREPGGTAIGEQIREILLNKSNKAMHQDSELLLMFAARVQHVKEKILPSLQQGKWVVSDRFVDSSFAYQGGGRGMDLSRIEVLEQWALEGLKPDLTLLLDLDPAIGMARAKQRGELDRFEQEQLQFFHEVRAVFLQRAEADKERFRVIDAAQTAAEVKAEIIKKLRPYVD